MINVKHLTKSFGTHKAVDDISFELKEGEILGFLGQNGAGKTTTMNILTGYLSFTDGEVSIHGYDILEHPMQAKRYIGYLPEQPPLYLEMTVEGYLKFVCNIKKVEKKERASQIHYACESVGITEVRSRIIGRLSKGFRQRVGIAQALIGKPEVLILDEPTVGLDPKQMIDIRDLIRKLGKTHTIILSSHILSEIQAVCDRIIIINDGKILADDTAKNLADSFQDEACYTLHVSGEHEKALYLLKSIEGIDRVEEIPAEEDVAAFYLYFKPGKDPRKAIFSVLAAQQMPIMQLKSNALSLEDVFLKVVSGTYQKHSAKKVQTEEGIL